MIELVTPRRRAKLIHELHHSPGHQVQGSARGVRFRLWIDAQLFSGGEQIAYRAAGKGLHLSGHALTVGEALQEIASRMGAKVRP